jgi:hypothetical protein
MSTVNNPIAQLLESLPPPNTNQSSNPFQSTLLDLSSVELGHLVNLRFEHQTKQAASGVRKATSQKLSDKQKKLTEKQILVRELEAIINQQQDIGAGTGVERAVRWTGRNPAPGGRDGNVDGEAAAIPAAGNSANAAAAAKASAGAVS